MNGHGKRMEIQARGYRSKGLRGGLPSWEDDGLGPQAPPQVERRKVKQRLRRRVTLRLAERFQRRKEGNG